jgi:hypothetical protein
MALSAVGAAFSAGAAAVCAMAAELNTKTPASAASAASDLFPRPIALLLFRNVRLRCRIVANRDHRETALSCKAGPDRDS